MITAANLLIVLATASVACAATYPPANPTFDPSAYTTWGEKTVGKSRRAQINVPFTAADGSQDFIALTRLDLVGNDYERGYAHGFLMAKEMIEFAGPKLNQYFREMILEIDVSSLPEPLQKIFKAIEVIGAALAPKVFHEAMAWVWEQEKGFVPDYIKSEISGIGAGLCDSGVLGPKCDATEWAQKIAELNMLPELIRMACTAYGAWGKATDTGKSMIQLRALDFGGGPFANYTIAATYRDAVPTAESNAFVSITFPGFAGVITGVSQRGIGVSEKVWMTYDRPEIQPGSYNGEADIFVLRDILQQSKNKADAEAYVQQANRTWAIFIGAGDYETQTFDLIGYKQDSVTVYTDKTIGQVTGQPYIENVCYVDKHPQPSGDGPTGTLPTALQDFYGNISLETSKSITQYHQTGDLHIASYDFTAKNMNLAIGRINKEGQYKPEGGSDDSQWKAYNRPYLRFSLDDLWNGK